MTTLIEPESVSLQQLADIFKNAFMKILIQDDERIVLGIDEEKVLIEITPEQNRCNIILITSLLSKYNLAGVHEDITTLVNDFNSEFISNRFRFGYDSDEVAMLISNRDIFYSFGLNPPQLIDDIRRLVRIHKSAIAELASFLKSKGLI